MTFTLVEQSSDRDLTDTSSLGKPISKLDTVVSVETLWQ